MNFLSTRPGRAPRLLLVRLSAVGDVVHGMPVARSLRRRFPGAEIVWAVQPGPAPLLEHHPWVDRTLLFPRRNGLRAVAAFLGDLGRPRFDLAVDVQGNSKSALVLAASRAPIRLGLARRDLREPFGSFAANRRALPATGPHSVDRSLALCRALGDPEPRPEFGLRPTLEELARARDDLDRLPSPLVAFSVGRREDVREWPDEAYVATGRRLQDAGVPVLVLSGPKHRQRALFIAGRLAVPARAGTTDLRGLLAHLAVLDERGGVLVACDSAPIHLATAVGLRTLVLSGPQDPRRTGPYGRPRSSMIRWEGLSCAPCLKRSCDADTTPRACMNRIEPAEVARRARELLHEAGAAPSTCGRGDPGRD